MTRDEFMAWFKEKRMEVVRWEPDAKTRHALMVMCEPEASGFWLSNSGALEGMTVEELEASKPVLEDKGPRALRSERTYLRLVRGTK